jgi:dephospho-CoA kinase
VAAFGPEVLTADGALDRPALARRVFGDDVARRTLEGIIHPRVRARTAELVAAAPADAVVVNDVPLLVESGLAGAYELVIVVIADEETRVSRLVADRGMTRAEALARIRAQATDEQRRAVADIVIVNDGALDKLDFEVDEVWRQHLAPR